MTRYYTTEQAAEILQCSVEALQCRCRRSARRQKDGTIAAKLGAGIIAYKYGRLWKVQFPDSSQSAA